MAQEPESRGTGSAVLPHWHSPDSETTTIVEGDGVHVTDDTGTEYLDFASQLYCVNAGHSNEAIVEAMAEQLRRIPYVSSASHTPVRSELADRLVEVAPDGLDSVFFSISGSEANEAAAQLAREYTGGHKVLTRWRSYHGATYGAASLTGDPSTRNAVEQYAATTGSAKFLPPVPYRSPFDAETPEELSEQAADHLEFVIRNEGPDSVAAVLTEPVAGTSGSYPAPPGYFERVREICDAYDVLLISDEVITGFGRCGDWFGIGTEDVEPDMITFAKGVTSAYAPLAGVLARGDVGDHVREEGIAVGQTFAGHPVACAGGVAALSAYEDGLIENVRGLESHFEDRLSDLAGAHEVVGDVRGRGFLWGVEFTNPETGEPFVDPWVEPDAENPVDDVKKATKDRGVMIGGGRPGYQVTLSPPLSATADDIDRAVNALSGAVDEVF